MIRDSLHRSKVPAHIHFETSTDKGLREVEKKNFDLILTDHSLPKANAFHLLSELQDKRRTIPIVLLTREGGARAARDAFQRGVDDYLLKEELGAISLFDVIGNLIERRRQKDERIEKEIRLREQAEKDGLTHLYNHRHFLNTLEKEFMRARRYQRSLALIMVDLDGFKLINDTCGHPQGDQVLQNVSRLLLLSVRFVDLVARYGGDEFAILLPETDGRSATRIAERINHEIQKNPFLYEKKVFPISASLGVACLNETIDSAGKFLKEADQALYEAKKNGRNRVVVAKTSSFEAQQQKKFLVSLRS
ncbi:MAG: diguanylate cyclase [Deltaproteobacteria bacterium]|nr:diguanylate cyclase [Deltaproteobacteria bacterium]